MDYFECAAPAENGRCSDNACPCPEVEIPRGKGYLFISQELVDFRRQYPGEEQAGAAMEARLRGAGFSGGFYSISPVLVCEQGAKLRHLDLTVAAADAAHWWATGKVPLRATPGASRQAPAAQTRSENEQAGEPSATALAEQPTPAASSAVESGVCECGATVPSDAPLCESCGRAHGWEPVVLAKEDAFKDLTCPKCPDILIPARAVFLLHVMGKTINCPTCKTELMANADKAPKWQLPPSLAAKMPTSEEALLAEVKRLQECGQKKAGAEHLAETRAIPVEDQLAGRYLLHWLDQHDSPSEAVLNAVAVNWMGHITLNLLMKGTPNLTPQQLQAYYVTMHYGSFLVHQADHCLKLAKIGHGARYILISKLALFYDDWGKAKPQTLPYDGRLAMEEAYYSAAADARAYPGDANKAGVLNLAQMWVIHAPGYTNAVGCRKGAGGRVSSPASGCFVATACYGDYNAPEVLLLRQFRDTHLLRSPLTRPLVGLYYKIGPHLAACLHRHPRFKPSVRGVLTRLAQGLEKRGFTHNNHKQGDEI